MANGAAIIASRTKIGPRTTQQLLVRGAKVATYAGTMAEHMYREKGVTAIRRIQGLLALAQKHGAVLADDGCATALEIGVPTNPYRFVRPGWKAGPTYSAPRGSYPPPATLYRDPSTEKLRRTTQNEFHRTAAFVTPTPPRWHRRVLESRLRQTKAEPIAPIDLLSTWSRTNSHIAPIVCSNAGANRPASATEQDARQLRLHL